MDPRCFNLLEAALKAFYFCSESMPCYKLNVIKLKLNNIKGIITNSPDSLKDSIAVT